MAMFKSGDRVRVKERSDWPMPTGYRLTGMEGSVYDVVDDPPGYVLVTLDNKEATGLDPRVPLGFREEHLEKI